LTPIRLAVVLSAGGLRGAAHVGVLRQLVRHGVRIDALVGVSAGAIIAAYYAAVGLDFDELVRDAETFRGRHLLAYSCNVQLGYRFERRLAPACGVIPERLRQLEASRFDRLHHGVQQLGIVCQDTVVGKPCYFVTGGDHEVPLAAAVRASASIPFLFPAIAVDCGGRELRLSDGGVTDPLPVAFARGPEIGATHVIVSDCRWIGRAPAAIDPSTVWIRPRMPKTGTLWSPAKGLVSAVRDGEAAVSVETLDHVRSWFADDASGPARWRANQSLAS
jgi:NTE family protein